MWFPQQGAPELACRDDSVVRDSSDGGGGGAGKGADVEVSGFGVLEWIRCLVVVTGLSWWKFCLEQQGLVLAQLLSQTGNKGVESPSCGHGVLLPHEYCLFSVTLGSSVSLQPQSLQKAGTLAAMP